MKNIDFSSTYMDSCNIFIVCLLSSELITLTKIHLENMSSKTMFLMFDWRESNANARIMFFCRASSWGLAGRRRICTRGTIVTVMSGQGKLKRCKQTTRALAVLCLATAGCTRIADHITRRPNRMRRHWNTSDYSVSLGSLRSPMLASVDITRSFWKLASFWLAKSSWMFVKSISIENWTINGLMNYVTYLIELIS